MANKNPVAEVEQINGSYYGIDIGFYISGHKETKAIKELDQAINKAFGDWKKKWNATKKVKISRDSIDW